MSKNSAIQRVIIASSAGTMIEWYDFYVFGSLANIISTQFFPKENPTASFLFTLAAFGVGFVVRPFGALVFGRLGDLVGRKYTFLLTLLVMGGATFAIGLIPGFETIGVLSPILVFFLRAMQGLALGGEYGGATTYVAEHAPKDKKGFYTSFIQITATLGLFVSIGVILLCKTIMSESAFKDWGWRIPFLLSAILVFISFMIRKKMDESPEFMLLKKENKTSKNPLKESFCNSKNLKMVLLALFGITAGQGVVWYTSQFYALNFCTNTLHIDSSQIQKMLLVVLLLGTPLFIFFAWLSDKLGRKWIMLSGLALAAVLYIPIYKSMAAQANWKSWQAVENVRPVRKIIQNDSFKTIETVVYHFASGAVVEETIEGTKKQTNIRLPLKNIRIIGVFIFLQLLFVAMAYGPIAAFLVELFPVQIRYTSLSLPYHIGNGIFGGLTPLIAESLVLKTGNIFGGLYYPIIISAITVMVGSVLLSNKKH